MYNQDQNCGACLQISKSFVLNKGLLEMGDDSLLDSADDDSLEGLSVEGAELSVLDCSALDEELSDSTESSVFCFC